MPTHNSEFRFTVSIVIWVALRFLQITAILFAVGIALRIVGDAALTGSPVTMGSLLFLITSAVAACILQFCCIAIEIPHE